MPQTLSMSSEPSGSGASPVDTIVRPAYLWVPEHSTTAGVEAAGLAEQVGLILDPEQRLALDAVLAERPDRKWAGFEAAIIGARQNLKTFVFKVIALADIYLFDLNLVVWTAHEFDTAMEAFRDLEEIIEGSDYLRKRVKSVSHSHGDEGFEFLSGQRLRFKARTGSGGRGLTGDRVFLDEAFALQASHMASLMPTMSAKSMTGNPQMIYGSSAGQVKSAHLRTVRDRGRRGGDPRLVYIEWCAPEGGCVTPDCDHHYGIEGCVLDDVEKIRLANPALERRVSVEWVMAERRSLPAEEFARERLGWWDEPAGTGEGIPLERWASCAKPDAVLLSPVAFAVDVAPDQVSASVVACGGPVEVVEHRRGASWVVEFLKGLIDRQRPSAVGLDPSGPAGALIPDLEKAGITIRTASNLHGVLVLLDTREIIQACGALYSATIEGSLVHRNQTVLNDAVAGACRRQHGDAWKWSRTDSTVDITPLVGATVAFALWKRRAQAKADFFTI